MLTNLSPLETIKPPNRSNYLPTFFSFPALPHPSHVDNASQTRTVPRNTCARREGPFECLGARRVVQRHTSRSEHHNGWMFHSSFTAPAPSEARQQEKAMRGQRIRRYCFVNKELLFVFDEHLSNRPRLSFPSLVWHSMYVIDRREVFTSLIGSAISQCCTHGSAWP